MSAPELGPIDRKAEGDGDLAAGSRDLLAEAAPSPGSPLPSDLMGSLQTALEADLSGVQIHTGPASAAAASSVQASAYTIGQDVHFGAGNYDPGSPRGQSLIAHEVAHTVQQRGASSDVRQDKLEVSSPGDAHEVEAESFAQSFVAGGGASVSPVASGTVARAIQREAKGGPAVGGELASSFTLIEKPIGKKKIWILEIEAKVGADIGFKVSKGEPPKPGQGGLALGAKKEAEKEGGEGGGVTVSGGAAGSAKDGSVGIQAEIAKEFGSYSWHPTAKAGGKLTSKGAEVGIGFTLNHELFGTGCEIEFAPLEFKLVSWEKGKDPEFATLSTSAKVIVPLVHYAASDGKTYAVTLAPTFAIEAKPDPIEIAKWAAEQAAKGLGADILAVAGALALPVMVTAANLYLWAKSGHELDAFELCADHARGVAKAVANLAVGNPVHKDLTMREVLGAAGHMGEVNALLPTILTKMVTLSGLPEGAIAAAAKRPNSPVRDELYMAAWSAAWPKLREEALAAIGNDPSVRELRAAIKSYGDGGPNGTLGSYAEGF